MLEDYKPHISDLVQQTIRRITYKPRFTILFGDEGLSYHTSQAIPLYVGYRATPDVDTLELKPLMLAYNIYISELLACKNKEQVLILS